MRIYNSFDEIDYELKRLNLERKIAWEEIKQSGNEVQDSLTPSGIMSPILGGIKKFGIFFLLKKLFKR
ncbi:DUF6327 family protein [Aureibaculum sp. 2210JD6-5]|uniref:DUF6327 family protein n=1 Tax=Aureibaculum sp. 2210JD6-5 TaxID=3103957 RepID=UPI002AAE4D86|nr:DUF6327 family protein [Aureibaculum sp. 2210JD6-5]MDY7396627.1 DUF6327 family protein [Aureibaculum sp. 2210JD6-5]